MRKRRMLPPSVASTLCPFVNSTRKVAFGIVRIGRNELNSGFLRIPLATFGEKHRTMIRAAKILAQVEFAIDHFAFPLFPHLDHFSHR